MEKNLIRKALRGQALAEFSASDVNAQAIDEIYKAAGISKDTSMQRVLAHQKEVFAIISEVIDEMLPKNVENIMGRFAEVKSFARDAEVNFLIKNVGLRRARLSIKKGARGGVYRAARLDNKSMGMDTEVYTVGLYVTLEDILLGKVSLAELYQNILLGFEDKIYQEIVAALRTASTAGKASHAFTNDGTTAQLLPDLDDAIRVAKAYGDNVVVVGFRSYLAKITNAVDFIPSGTVHNNPNSPLADIDEIRGNGIVTLYKGTPILELPNFIYEDGATAVWTFKENQIFVLSGDAKPVKVAMKGEMYVAEHTEPTGSIAWNAHKIMGVGLLLVDDVCVITGSQSDSGKY